MLKKYKILLYLFCNGCIILLGVWQEIEIKGIIIALVIFNIYLIGYYLFYRIIDQGGRQ